MWVYFGVASIVGVIGYSTYQLLLEQFQSLQQQNEIQKKEEELRLTKEKEKKLAALKKIKNLFLSDHLVIDSNIWMHGDYDAFFQLLEKILRKANRKIIIYGVQFDEICNIKSSHEYGSQKSKRARLAINRIENFQKNEILKIETVSIKSERWAYADPVVLKLLISLSKESHSVVFISNDKELRIRARELVRSGQATTQVIGIEEIENDIALGV